ncbi:hypothetical protein [Microbacterium aurugineum]|uniref:hypothetical protein n=1 Tax=Microbacterium aurugineum TaxID=2851642 RepID=UPI0020C0F62F|nr:hypothetical protein [Microbacterium aurugineum]MCK8478941.1 hypothetical protein [Microbacterium aurugineum]
MPRHVPRCLAALALLGAAMTAATGCVVACPAIGYISTVLVDVSAVPEAVELQFCVENECSPAPGDEPTSRSNAFEAVPQDDAIWSLALDMYTPQIIEIRLFDAEGALIHESEQEISWTHSGGQCPGPSTAEPVKLEP